MTNYIWLDDLWFSRDSAERVARTLYRTVTGVDLERRRLLIAPAHANRIRGFHGPLSLPGIDLMQVYTEKIVLLGEEVMDKFCSLPSYASESRVFRSVFVVCSLLGEFSFDEMELLTEHLSIASPSGLFVLFGRCLEIFGDFDANTLLSEFRRLGGHVTLATVV